MACSLDYIDFVCQQLDGLGVIRTRKMFGDWCVYVDEKAVIIACDNACYVKMIPEIEELMKDAERGCPYEGAKMHYILDIDHAKEARQVVKILMEKLPYPKEKTKRK